jgi:hypothetical protein
MVREGAPDALRSFVLRHVSHRARVDIHNARDLVSRTLKYIPNPANQSVDEIWKEIEQAIKGCDWFLIYDLIEEMFRDVQWSDRDQDAFLREVNEFFYEQNLGWKLRTTVPIEGISLVAPEIVIRGSEAFEIAVTGAVDTLESSGRNSAKKELTEALQDLSRRPEPDLTGAVHHAMAALECIAADVCSETGETLGQVIKSHPDRFPAPLGDALSKLYGFASQRGRHVTSEGKIPLQKEVELIVTIAAAVTTYLLQ